MSRSNRPSSHHHRAAQQHSHHRGSSQLSSQHHRGSCSQLGGRLLLLLVLLQGLYILKLRFGPRADVDRQTAAVGQSGQSDGHDLTKLYSASSAGNGQEVADADSIHIGGARRSSHEGSYKIRFSDNERPVVRKFAGGGIDAKDDPVPYDVPQEERARGGDARGEEGGGLELRTGDDDDWMVDGMKSGHGRIVSEDTWSDRREEGDGGRGVELRTGDDDDWMVDGLKSDLGARSDGGGGGEGSGEGARERVVEGEGSEVREGGGEGLSLEGSGDEMGVDERGMGGAGEAGTEERKSGEEGSREGGREGSERGAGEEGKGEEETVWQSPLDEESEWSPLQGPPGGMTCRSWLQEVDDVAFSRDFEKQPIRVMDYEIRRYPCDVPCEMVGRHTASELDASLAGGVPRHKAVLRSMEPRGYYASNDPAAAHKEYGVVMTVHYDSDVPVQYGSWEEYDVMRPPVNKTASALAVAFISNCHANSFRLEAIKELSRYMEVHSYGRCLNNKPSARDKLPVLSRYKFSLAFENTCETDYVTEKYWQCLVAGSVPVVIGAPNIAAFAPGRNSYLQIRTLADVPRVAREMLRLSGNQTDYQEMLAWKRNGPSEEFLANMDISAVHSSCRLCILLADRVQRRDLDDAKGRRPCRCEAAGKRAGEKLVVYHLFVRERGTFRFTSVFLRSDHLTVKSLGLAIRRSFQKKGYRPVWMGKRPAVLGGGGEEEGEETTRTLKVYRIYPAGSTQRDALWGDAWFRNSSQVVRHVSTHPCARLEVIFV